MRPLCCLFLQSFPRADPDIPRRDNRMRARGLAEFPQTKYRVGAGAAATLRSVAYISRLLPENRDYVGLRPFPEVAYITRTHGENGVLRACSHSAPNQLRGVIACTDELPGAVTGIYRSNWMHTRVCLLGPR